jgi:hypothetical protein
VKTNCLMSGRGFEQIPRLSAGRSFAHKE